MDDWITVARVDEIPPGSFRTLDIAGIAVAVFNVAGAYHAIEDVCTHEAETLSDGTVEGLEIICPRHMARFSLVTGAVLAPPALEPVTVFPVRIEDGMIKIALSQSASLKQIPVKG